MRKLVLVSIALLLCGSGMLYAQDDMSESGAFDAGDLLIEMTGSPFDNGGTLLSFGSFRARYAVTDQIVPRLGASFDLDNEQDNPSAVSNDSEYTLMPGCEYHFRIDGGFRSFIALDALIGQRFASYESSMGPSVDGLSYVPSSPTSNVNGSRGYLMYGAGLSTGADYHFSSGFYIGAEVGFVLAQKKYDDVFIDGELFIDGTQQSQGWVNISNAIRVGFKLF